ncbi:pentatricopeptide repeat-containing protein At1g50270-like [Phalaenopsis equestris]|uniref:pentatricopeptide repeat-containing protein At1g50270-like n=1 Tax=Phalaenopsis equestris TaxID=78828 RepID=UPI0009E2FB8D|nr:pentatricopeptide repeat-containing protein At1g50270-like [Phalaenopsis equestris]
MSLLAMMSISSNCIPLDMLGYLPWVEETSSAILTDEFGSTTSIDKKKSSHSTTRCSAPLPTTIISPTPSPSKLAPFSPPPSSQKAARSTPALLNPVTTPTSSSRTPSSHSTQPPSTPKPSAKSSPRSSHRTSSLGNPSFTRNGCPGEALLAFASMDVEPNEMTLVSALSACSRLKDGNLGKILHGICVRRFGGHGGNVILDNVLLDVCIVCGAFTDAAQLFDIMPHRDVASATTMICGFVRYERYEEAIALFGESVRDGEIVPNEITVASVLGACASAGILSLGKWVHCYLLRTGIDVDGIVGNTLIHMYSKCGAIGAALRIFGRLQCRDLVSWCTIMNGMAINGMPKHSIQLFSLMLCYGVRPDNVAFLAVMSACCHAGLLEDCLMFFVSMYDIYGILPEKEHYTCVIDTYGRAARLREAEDFFVCMPMKPDKCAWGALLSACGTNEVAYERIQKRVFHLGMTLGGGTYALLSNMFAKAEKWDESNNVRKQLDAKKVRKPVGYSWMEVA